jgi:hypothetical protein
MEINVQGAVTSLYFDVFPGWKQTFYLGSDHHYDSVHCNRALLTQHLEQMKDENALGLFVGDWFDAMQGRFDPRRSMEELRPEFRTDKYYDVVVKDSADYLKPYASNILVMARGNHETAVIKNAGTDLLDRLTEKLRMAGGITRTGGYGGWIRLMFNMSDGQNTGPRTSIKLKYFHGSGGDAPVTKGVIWTNRQATYLPDADIVVNGHNHNSYIVPIARERLSNKGVQYSDIQYHVRTPGYKQDYGDGSGGWAVEKGMPPKPVGCAWITLICRNNCIEIQPRTDIQGPEMMPSILSEDRGPIFEYAEP